MAAKGAQNSNGAAPGRPFKPGESGNPGGRPKGLAAKIRELAPPDQLAGYYTAIWARDEDKLLELGITLKDVTLAERTKAADWLADRGYGKAPQYAAQDGDPLDLDVIDQSINAVLDELAAKRETKAPGTGAEGELEAGRAG